MYEVAPFDAALDQGDIFDDCPVIYLESLPVPPPVRARVVVLTQACDLAQTKTERVLVALIKDAQKLVSDRVLKENVIRDQVRHHGVYGWCFLPAAPSPIDLAESIVDLHDLHTLSRPLMEQFIAEGKRFCRILTPWREHLAKHFADTYSRIGLPMPYETQQ